MQHFSIGIVSFAFAILFALAVILRYALVAVGIWYRRQPPNKDRVLIGIIAAAVFGFVAGSFLQPAWDQGVVCKAEGQPIVPCVLSVG